MQALYDIAAIRRSQDGLDDDHIDWFGMPRDQVFRIGYRRCLQNQVAGIAERFGKDRPERMLIGNEQNHAHVREAPSIPSGRRPSRSSLAARKFKTSRAETIANRWFLSVTSSLFDPVSRILERAFS